MILNVAQLQTLQLILLAFFTIATTLLALVTITNTMRLRNIQQVWASGKLMGFPLFATLFLAFTVVVSGLVYYVNMDHYLPALICYMWIGINWFAASYYMMKRYITDHGIVKNINDPSQTISWFEIVDYVERKNADSHLYTFFYIEEDADSGTKQTHKLELPVPQKEHAAFKKIMDRKLSRRFATGNFTFQGLEQIKKDNEL